MHLGGNRRQVPLTNEALSIIIYVKISRYAMLRRIKRCKRVLYLDRSSQDEKNKNLFQNKKLRIYLENKDLIQGVLIVKPALKKQRE